MACAPSEDSDQPGHPPSLIRVLAVRMKKAWVLSYVLKAQRRLRSPWADAGRTCHFVSFAMKRLNYSNVSYDKCFRNLRYLGRKDPTNIPAEGRPGDNYRLEV